MCLFENRASLIVIEPVLLYSHELSYNFLYVASLKISFLYRLIASRSYEKFIVVSNNKN